MNDLLALLPLVLMIAVYWWGFRRFKAKHGKEVQGPQGQTPYGVHGLLAFFIFASYYMAPLFVMATVNSNFMKVEAQYPNLLSLPGYGTYKSCTFILVVAVIVWQIIVARQLRWKLEPASLRSARMLCVGVPIVFILADVILGKLTLNVLPNAEAMLSYMGSIIMSSIWAAYFFVSKRCRNTYLAFHPNGGHAENMVQSAEVPVETFSQTSAGTDVAQRLIKLQELQSAGLLSESEYQTKRNEILGSI